MSTVPVFVSLDYHQSTIQVCVMNAGGIVLLNCACENRWPAVVEKVLSAGVPVRVAIEACTGASDLAQELVDQAGWAVDLAHTTYVSRMKRQPDKTDYSDARMLADLTRVGYLPRVWLPPVYIRDLRRLVSLRDSLVSQRRNLKLRLTSLLRDHRVTLPMARWTRAWLQQVQAPETLPAVGHLIAVEILDQLPDVMDRIRRVQDQMDLFIQGDPNIAYLRTLPCVGPVTSWVMRAFIGDVTRFKNGKQLAHYCGLSPGNASSGQRVADAGLVNSGNTLLRATLIELGQRLARTQPRWKAFRQRLQAGGKAHCVIIAAIANRFVRAAYYPWKQMQLTSPTPPALPERCVLNKATGEVSSSR
jgi:transposase